MPSFTHRNLLIALILLTSVAMCLWMVLLQTVADAVTFSVIDDAMYYFAIARNVAVSGVFTCDGITITNGFHPLWELVLIPLAWLFRDPNMLLHAGFVLSAALFLAALLLFFRLASHLRFTDIGIVTAFIVIFANLRSFTLWFSLIESVLLLFCLMGYLVLSVEVGTRRITVPRTAFLWGALIGVIFLARLDSFLLFPCYLYYMARHFSGTKERGFLRAATFTSAGAAIVVLPYLAINLRYFGMLMTVSSWRKSYPINLENLAGPLQRFYSETLVRFVYVLNLPDSTRVLIAALLACGIAGIIFLGRRAGSRLKTPMIPIMDFLAFAGLHFVFVFIFVPTEAIFSIWYHVVEILALGLVSGVLLGVLLERAPIVRACVIVAAAAFLIWQFAFYPSFMEKKSMTTVKLEMAGRVAEFVPAGERVAMYDAGIVGYFADRPVVALNGLVGDIAMAKLSKQARYGELCKQYHVAYLVADVPVSLIDSLPGTPVYVTSIRTRMMNMNEEPKPLVLYRMSASDVDGFFARRYK